MAAPPVYLDECVDVALADALRRRGFIVTIARDHGPVGAGDEEQILYATSRGWIILSHNARHFRRWHRAFVETGRSHDGMILIPETGPVSRLALRAAMMLDWIATLGDHRGRLFRWGDLQYQLTQGYRLPGYDEADARLALGQEP